MLAVDTSWCLRNKENLDVMSFAKEFGYTDQAKYHARYKAILDNHIPSEDKLHLQQNFTNWKETLLSFGKYYQNDQRLRVSSILVTSCKRIDVKHTANIGPTNNDFELLSKKDSLSTKIFIGQECLESALNMLKDPNTSQVDNMGIMYQLRQIRSKFHVPSTYFLCRAYGPLTKSHSCQPVTIFTLAGHSQGRNAVAALFYNIGLQVVKHGIKSRLLKTTVEASLSKASDKNNKLLEEILLLFKDTEEVEIIGNVVLNGVLEKLAFMLMPVIVAANGSVCSHVDDVFESYD